ncbi:MARVEL domain-containing protein 2-like, partial [Megalops cyprinoides]|uniref:MARVEL domain-containing protein 2-like n=1 Tax=Megalops cyprinoides TaxID=118141 RepID=UPI00186485B2
LRDKMKKNLLPQSWSGLFRKWRRGDGATHQNLTERTILPNGTRVSPPVSPQLQQRYWDQQDSLRSSKSSQKPLLTDSPTGYSQAEGQDPLEGSELTSIHPAQYYAEKLEVYQQKYSYMKSWPGLLRLLAGIQLLFGGMVFACVCAYIQKDSEWYNLYGFQGPSYIYGGYGTSGYYYNGPMTPFVLAVAGLAWLVTVILLVLGLTMYYRTILLDSHWWPLTESVINVAVFLLYMAAGIVYVNDLNRGGLCYLTIGFNPLISTLCRVEGGQMAGTAFIFINMLMYLISFLVCLKMWRHEAARQAKEALEKELHPPNTTVQSKSKRIIFEDEMDHSMRTSKRIHFSEDPGTLNRAIPTGYVPKPQVIADYIMKYPEIHSVEDREQYKAVFNDQYQEYKELHCDINATLKKFSELDAMMGKLLSEINSYEEQRRIQQIMRKYNEKKNDPAFSEKRERYEYLKAKLKHIKSRIQDFDQDFYMEPEERKGQHLRKQPT